MDKGRYIEFKEPLSCWNYRRMIPVTDKDWLIYKDFNNFWDRIKYGLSFLFVTPIAGVLLWFAATQPFVKGEGNFALVWFMWIVLAGINYGIWRDYFTMVVPNRYGD